MSGRGVRETRTCRGTWAGGVGGVRVEWRGWNLLEDTPDLLFRQVTFCRHLGLARKSGLARRGAELGSGWVGDRQPRRQQRGGRHSLWGGLGLAAACPAPAVCVDTAAAFLHSCPHKSLPLPSLDLRDEASHDLHLRKLQNEAARKKGEDQTCKPNLEIWKSSTKKNYIFLNVNFLSFFCSSKFQFSSNPEILLL